MRDALSVLSWWVLIQLIGLAAWPLAFRLLRSLPDRGYTAAKPLGLLLASYALWLLGSLGLAPNSLGGILFALILVIAASAWALSRDGVAAMRDWLRRHRAMVLAYEVLFAVAMVGWAAFRATNAGINSTEKPMEFAFLNAILRSPSFPPHDPWLSGYGISYYYFGYVMMAIVTRLAGTPPGVAYNVSSALWFALIAGGAFGAAYQIYALKFRNTNWKPILVAIAAAVFVVFLGNLEGALELAHRTGVGSAEFWKWLDIKDISDPPSTGDVAAPLRHYWWWRASRVVHDYTPQGGDQEVIDEFPFFSFLNGDLHPHTLAYPFVFLAMSLALNVYVGKMQDARDKTQEAGGKRQEAEGEEQEAGGRGQSAGRDRWRGMAAGWMERVGLSWPDLFLYAVCLGALGFLNTWDFPIYLFLVVAALALRQWQVTGQLDKVITDAVVLGAILGVAGLVLYLPFYVSFQSQARGILPNLFNGTRLPQFLVMFGQFAVPGALFLLALAALRARVSAWRFWLGALGWAVTLLLAASLVGLLMGAISPDGRAALKAWQTGQPIPGLDPNLGMDIGGRLLERLFDPWTALLLALALVVIVKLVSWRAGEPESQPAGDEPAAQPLLGSAGIPFVLLLFFLGGALALSVEFIYLADTFGTRMNTVFKFYYQTWALWGVAGACAIGWLLEDSGVWAPFRIFSGAVSALLVAASLVYPFMALSTLGDPAHPTLDGTAWVAQQSPDDYAAIQWLNQNVSGTPVILEAPGQSYRSDLSRVSAYTGLPTVLGWPGHELQWRGNYEEAGRREPDVKAIYTTREAQEALTLMDKYAISYVYVGPAEQSMFPSYGLNKFETMMDVAFRHESVTIYRRR